VAGTMKGTGISALDLFRYRYCNSGLSVDKNWPRLCTLWRRYGYNEMP